MFESPQLFEKIMKGAKDNVVNMTEFSNLFIEECEECEDWDGQVEWVLKTEYIRYTLDWLKEKCSNEKFTYIIPQILWDYVSEYNCTEYLKDFAVKSY